MHRYHKIFSSQNIVLNGDVHSPLYILINRTLNKMRENLAESVSMAWTEENNVINVDLV